MSADTYVSALRCALVAISEGELINAFELQQPRQEWRSIHALAMQYNRRLTTGARDLERFKYRLGTRLAREIEQVGTILRRPQDMYATTCRIRRTVSEKKLLANRRNALRSTGPASGRGKQTARQNAIKHGLSAQEICLLQGEDGAEFDVLCWTLLKASHPQNEFCRAPVRNITTIAWKLGRAMRIINGFAADGGAYGGPVHRYANALSSDLRNEIQLLATNDLTSREGGTIEMPFRRGTWDLRRDGFLWKQAIKHQTDQGYRNQCETFIEHLQQSADRTDWQMLMLHDLRAAAYFQKCHVAQVEAAQLNVAQYNARENIERVEQAIREDARLAASWPNQDARDQTTKAHSLYNREIFKSTELIKALECRGEPASRRLEQSPVLDQAVDRKPRRVE